MLYWPVRAWGGREFVQEGTSRRRTDGREVTAIAGFVERFPPPEIPWTHEYAESHRALVREALEDPSLIGLVGGTGELPVGYGVGFDERVVEFPWVIAQGLRGRTLDAGSALNHAHVLDRVLADVSALHVVTLAPEEAAFTERAVSYVYADLRDLPYRDSYFTTVVSLSTVEHVGMDNAIFGVDMPRAKDPDRELGRAVAELVRVVEPGGLLLITVPYGQREDHEWFRQFDRTDVQRLIALVPARRSSCDVFRYSRSGWEKSDLAQASGARYRDFLRDQSPVADLAAAARAVACLRFDF